MERIYIDTSVIGGRFDKVFEEDTKLFFERFKNSEFIIVISGVTEDELIDAPENVKEFYEKLPLEHIEKVKLTKQAAELADKYIEEKVVGKTNRADCLHIATATLNKVDILVSWNFKHIVNIEKIRGYNSVNLRLGHHSLEIRTPKESLKYEN